MKSIERNALVGYSARQMFNLVNDIESYPKFMPGCTGASVLAGGVDWMEARLDLTKAGLKQSVITVNQLNPPNSITLALQSGPFKKFHGQWLFQPLAENACKVVFRLEYEFANKLVGLAVGKLFEQVASEQVDAICKRAKEIY